jgi:hypothetical protein
MRRHISLVMAAVFILLGVTGFPIIYYLWLLQQTPVIASQLDQDILYALAVPGIIIELEKEKGIRSLDGTVLELDRNDLHFLLQTSFSEEEIRTKALEVHRSIVDHVQVGARDTFSFAVSVSREFPIFQEKLLRIFRRKMLTRPECSMGQFLGIAWRSGVGKLFGVKPPTPDEQLRKLPRCRPPEVVQEGVLSAVKARLDSAQARAPDSILVRPAFGTRAHRFVRRSLSLGQAGTWLLPVFPLLIGVIGVLSWKERKACYARFAAPLMITGLLLLLVHVPLYYYYRDIDLFSTIQKQDPDYHMSESTGQWLQLVFYLLRGVMQVAARNVAFVAWFLILAGLIMLRQHQRCPAPVAKTPN